MKSSGSLPVRLRYFLMTFESLDVRKVWQLPMFPWFCEFQTRSFLSCQNLYCRKMNWTVKELFLSDCINTQFKNCNRTKSALFLATKSMTCLSFHHVMMWAPQNLIPKIFVGLVMVSMTLSALYLRIASSCWAEDTNHDKKKFVQMLNHKV